MENETTKIKYMASNLTVFEAENEDLKGGVNVKIYKGTKKKLQIADFVEFGAWYMCNIHPTLKSFNGFDTVRYNLGYWEP